MMNLIDDLLTERARQDRLHPTFPADIRFAILVEEVGEVAQELQADLLDKERLKAELTQVAAVALRWLEHLPDEKSKQCKACGNPFQSVRRDAVVCGKTCQKRLDRKREKSI